MNLTLISTAAAIVVGFATGFGAAWQTQAKNILEIEVAAKDERIARGQAARATSERYSLALSVAQTAAQDRRAVIAASVRSNSAGLIGLRNTTDTVRSSATSDSSCNAYGDAITKLFDQCSEALVRVAGEADGHVSDKQTLIEAWPR